MRTRRPIWVIKAGSQMVIDGGLLLIRDWMEQVQVLSKKHGVDVVWVTSGAIATARSRVRGGKIGGSKRSRRNTVSEKQAFSAIGQPLVLDQYNLALQNLGRRGAQVLLTADDLRDRKRRGNLIGTLRTLLAWGVVPILNENDAVATDEIQFGDNDRLSALVARHLGAKKLVLLTDVDGLFDRDPRKYDDAHLIRSLPVVTPKLLRSVSSVSISGVGRGGMLSKLMAAREAGRDAITTHLIKGDTPKALLSFNEINTNSFEPGTRIGAAAKAPKRRGRQ